ncbi:hypothetical protein CALVIDRAFT_311045 [Calocera viscosa TUFC12733]|uniref:Uncharacterized protein n=1 Tax=Calocera viscosa (strain TUFC12733) TaxID=1330018 RepID=A0A167I3E1_CALVF|nr:hypothetical protein CALVIDRAFT_311045 [Calocera viscosa TUFC12733]
MFAPMLAHSSRLVARQAPLAARRGFAAAAKHGHVCPPSLLPQSAANASPQNEMPAMPVETYPLIAVVLFGTGYGIYSSVHAWFKEPDAFSHHRSAGNQQMKY